MSFFTSLARVFGQNSGDTQAPKETKQKKVAQIKKPGRNNKQQKQQTKKGGLQSRPIKGQKPQKPSIDVLEAETKAREIIFDAKDKALKIRSEAEDKARKLQEKYIQDQNKLNQKVRENDRLEASLQEKSKYLAKEEVKVKQQQEHNDKLKRKIIEKLEEVGAITREEAKKQILDAVKKKSKKDIALAIRDAEEKARSEADEKAQDILVDAMKHGATDYVPEFTVSTVELPSEEIKGRLIGKEGRNIRAFEKYSGVDLDLDESPTLVRLSSFDSVRREIAKVALKRLVKDGRIQPTRIEEYLLKAKKEIERVMFEEGKKLCHAVGAYNVPHDLIAMLGRFKYRTSYGQNMIAHTLEETKIGIALAHEVGANVDTVRLGCLFHDIGKIVTDEEGSHVELGVKVLKKYQMPKPVVDAVAQHHEDEPFSSNESILVYIADAMSGARPGARMENYDDYVKRLKRLEEVAMSRDGVKEAYAIQAGRELRIIVNPEKMDDDGMVILADDIRDEIKATMTYPGTVTVNVVRETRAKAIAK